MKKAKLALSVLISVGALTIAGISFGSVASASDPVPTVTTSPTASVGDDTEITTLLAAQPEVTSNSQEADSSVDVNTFEDAQEQSAFDADIKAAVAAGDSATAAQLTASAAIVTSIDAPEVQAMAADDTEAHNLIIGVAGK